MCHYSASPRPPGSVSYGVTQVHAGFTWSQPFTKDPRLTLYMMHKHKPQLLIALATTIAFFLLNGCSALNQGLFSKTAPAEAATNTDPFNSQASAEVVEKPRTVDFDQNKDTLYDLLVAEIAAQRNQLGVTLLNYIDQAMSTRDLGIVQRAVDAAQFVKDAEATIQMALLWSEIAPNDPAPHQILAFQYALQKNFAEAVSSIEKLLLMGEESRIDSLAISSLQMPEEDRRQLLELYQELGRKHPNRYEITYSTAIVMRGLSMYEEAEALLRRVIEEKPAFEPGWLLLANTLFESRQSERAEQVAREAHRNFPHNQSIARVYASTLIEARKFDQAEQVFEHMIAQAPEVTAMRLTLALVKLENQKPNEAREILLDLRNQGLHQNESNYYLGRIAQQQEQLEEALAFFESVTPGPHFEVAIQHSAQLLIERQELSAYNAFFDKLRSRYPDRSNLFWRIQFDALHKADKQAALLPVLDAALEAHPEDNQLRYARAMVREQNGDFLGMEADLRAIIRNEPTNAVAMNALGYTLADRNERLNEALILIGGALSLDKENPAIIDSMGWVLYRLGKLPEALLFLAKAYSQNNDSEIAAHFAEVLWMVGKQKEAKVILKRAWLLTPEHKILKSTIDRLVPEFYEQVDQIDVEPAPDATVNPANNAETNASEKP